MQNRETTVEKRRSFLLFYFSNFRKNNIFYKFFYHQELTAVILFYCSHVDKLTTAQNLVDGLILASVLIL